jgi:hypothetical protein
MPSQAEIEAAAKGMTRVTGVDKPEYYYDLAESALTAAERAREANPFSAEARTQRPANCDDCPDRADLVSENRRLRDGLETGPPCESCQGTGLRDIGYGPGVTKPYPKDQGAGDD